MYPICIGMKQGKVTRSPVLRGIIKKAEVTVKTPKENRLQAKGGGFGYLIFADISPQIPHR